MRPHVRPRRRNGTEAKRSDAKRCAAVSGTAVARPRARRDPVHLLVEAVASSGGKRTTEMRAVVAHQSASQYSGRGMGK